ncbi:unnamed protein product [Paramecium octaurelia]|uniref:Cytosolic iron-sulfur protein assembly protein CIAO1 homolog n=1 Tax=Paramecium octaurelia TaxID=43137 RepID=A0A8S1UAZ6_PAROT|nr:unnamed protein product [Paramecium octaurelia]
MNCQLLKDHKERVWQVAWHPNGQILASCSSDKTIKLWQLMNDQYKLIQTLDECHTKSVRSVSFSKDGQFLASGGFDTVVGVWMYDGSKYKLIQQLEGHESEVKGVAWSADSNYLASCGRDKTVWIWDHEDLEFSCNCVLQAHDEDVKCIKWKDTTLYSGSYDNSVIRYTYGEDDEWDHKQFQIEHQSTIWSIDIFNKLLLSTSADCTAKVFSIQDGTLKPIQTLQGFHKEPIYSGSFSYDGLYFALGSADNKISVFKKDAIDELGYPHYALDQIFDAFEFDVNCVAFNPKNYLLAACSDDENIKVFNLQL